MLFLLTLGIFRTISFCFYYWFWTGKYRLGRQNKMKDLCHFHINSFSSSFWAFSIQSGVSFYIPIYWGYYILPCHDFKGNIQEEKTIFNMAKSITRSNIFNSKEKDLKFVWTYFGLLPQTIFKVQKTCVYFIYNVS